MKRSTERILTTHAGSLPRPSDLLELYRAKAEGGLKDEKLLADCLSSAVARTVARQKQVGVDIPGDGELAKATTEAVDYAPWITYAYPRLKGFSGEISVFESRKATEDITFPTFFERRDFLKFKAFYQDRGAFNMGSKVPMIPVCTGPVRYFGQQSVQTDIRNLKAAMTAAGVDEAFISAASPGTIERWQNNYYRDDTDYLYAIAEAMREEYKAVVDAGLILQIDDPGMPELWDQANPEPALETYKKFARVRIEALNYALRSLPEDRIRYHICWGSWHGPHSSDIPLRDIVDLLLAVRAGAYSVEAGNVRHEHEWKVWREIKLPKNKILIPGVVSHATNVIEHPELVADRIVRFANLVGRESVIAGTDCGLGGRIHEQLVWAKLQSLAEGAALATKQLWS